MKCFIIILLAVAVSSWNAGRVVNLNAGQQMSPMTPIDFWCNEECALLTQNHTNNICRKQTFCDYRELFCRLLVEYTLY